jgi:hypothetical protein
MVSSSFSGFLASILSGFSFVCINFLNEIFCLEARTGQPLYMLVVVLIFVIKLILFALNCYCRMEFVLDLDYYEMLI